MAIAISPHFDPSKLASGTLEDKIDVFEDQVLGWLVEPAKLMTSYQHAGFAILAIALAYFEPLGQFLEGSAGPSEKRFTTGLKAVFPNVTSAPNVVFGELYNQLRCGMFHRGITKGKVFVARGHQHPIDVTLASDGSVASITVDPWYLLNEIEAHLERYTAELRTPANSQLRASFEAWFNARSA